MSPAPAFSETLEALRRRANGNLPYTFAIDVHGRELEHEVWSSCPVCGEPRLKVEDTAGGARIACLDGCKSTAIIAALDVGRSADSWRPIDLGPVLANDGQTEEAPTIGARTDGVCLLYRGKLHSTSGEPEACKGWKALASGAEVLGSGRRSKVFHSAIEQFEQLLRASEAVSAASSPILTFYALSQAGRAILAAHGPKNSWDTPRHGLSIDTRQEIGHTVIRPNGEGLFQAVAATTESQALNSPVNLDDAWAAAPRFVRASGLGGSNAPPLLLVLETGWLRACGCADVGERVGSMWTRDWRWCLGSTPGSSRTCACTPTCPKPSKPWASRSRRCRGRRWRWRG